MAEVMDGMVGGEGDARNSPAGEGAPRGAGAVLLAVAAGGALGSVLRVVVGWWVVALLGAAFPWGTLSVNLSGSLALGFLDARLPSVPPAPWRAFAIPGFCGGFTTFSAFGVETVFLLEAGTGGGAAAYVVGSALLCLAGVVAGGAWGRGRPEHGSTG